MRKIPSTMVSQHPDNASKPYWHTEAYISDQHEVKECFYAFSKLGVCEYKWDWEGKFVDESVFERLISEYPTFFQRKALGKEIFLTFRLPDFRVKTEFRFGRSLMSILSAAGLAKELGLHSPPMFEAILPMTQSAEEMIQVQEAFTEISELANPLYNFKNSSLKHLEIIPLFESIDSIVNSTEILKEYLKLHKKKFNFTPSCIRPYLARSDSALTSGIVPSVLAIKIALSKFGSFQDKEEIPLFPIIGAGSLPFRGGATPYEILNFTKQYSGIKTMLIQSAFQYDYDLNDVIKAVQLIDEILPKGEAKKVSLKEEKEIKKIIKDFESFYQPTVKKIGSMIYSVATFLPARRERLKHTGLLKYPRFLGDVKIPRAIGFTASLYSLGVPPELIGTGRALKRAEKKELELIEKFYPSLKHDLERAGKYLNKKNLKKLTKKLKAEEIMEDVKSIEEFLGHELKPTTSAEKAHQIYTCEIYDMFLKGFNITGFIEEAAIFRKSLG